ncbi:RHS repeat-associated protein [Streptomyces sp. CEV 2-1]|uniref:DUF6531 domain-containing protein n=1 Tax=Streptomyces sp. CEV 2-1 TaxID=2485153 RepID=UPI000F472710|nr:DUF6531 domain-containing protein [Streptomyces sp. CEV 2-1]ROQ77021.1 RHS repeat-associated protein [Streptomyces sp. CEV 2-1]
MAFWMAAASVWAVLQLLLLSWPARTVRWPLVALAFGVGMYGCGVASMFVELVTARQLAASRHESLSAVMDTVSWTTAPAAEELIKILPLLIAGWALRRRMQWGLTDFVVLGGATGAGFGLLESLSMYGGSAGRAVALPAGGWRIVESLGSHPYVPDFWHIVGSWFPASTGTEELEQPVMPYDLHIFASALGGLAVGLLWCARRPLLRAAGLLPLAAAVAIHGVNNYAAVFSDSDDDTAMWWREQLTGTWGLWIVLGTLAAAWLWDQRRARRGKDREPGVRLNAEREGRTSWQALLDYALLHVPATWIIAFGYARQRRALLYASAHPRSDPDRLTALREVLTEQTRRMDATHNRESWLGTSLRELWKRARAQRRRWPLQEKLLLVLGLLIAIPSLLYLGVGSFKSTQDLQEYFAEGTGLRLLIGVALAGLALTVWRLALTVRGYRPAAAQPQAEALALVHFRLVLCTGSLAIGLLFLYRWEEIAKDGNLFNAYETLGTGGFLLEKLLEVDLPLLLSIAMLALMFTPMGGAAGLLMGGSMSELLLGALAPRLVAPLATRLGARLAARSVMGWARGALGRGRGAFARGRNRLRHGRTDPVDLATGRMFLPLTDLELPGTLPLVFSRRVDSGYRAGGWFGPAWASTVDQRLEFDEHGVVFFTEDSRLLAYPHPVAGGAPVWPAEGDQWPVALADNGTYTLTDPDSGWIRLFTPHDEGLALLRQITDRHGNRIAFSYDAEGAPTEIVHSGGYRLQLTTAGNRVTALHLGKTLVQGYRYDQAGNLTETVNSSGLPLVFGYDSAGRITSWTDTNNRSYAYTYDEQDRVIAEGGEGGHYACRLEYDGTHPEHPGLKVTTLTSTDGAVSRYLIDDRHLVVGEIDPAGTLTRTTYDDHGRTLAETDAMGRTTGVRYDASGQPAAVIRPDGSETLISCDSTGNPVQITGPDGAVWRQTFDAAGNRTTLTDPLGATTHYLYDPRGGLLAITDPLGATTRVRCNPAGLPVEITDPLGRTTLLERDAFGRVTSETDPLGAATSYAWSPEGQLLRCTTPDGATEAWTYDGEGNRTSHTNPAGGVTYYEYTHFDLLTARTDPDGARYTFAHDAQARLTQVTNPQHLTWSYSYDPAGHLISETDFDDRTLTYDHDPAGQLTASTDALGQITRYTYDTLGRLAAKDAAGRQSTFVWTPTGDLARATNPDARLSREYDPVGRLLSETVNGHALHLSYDPAGQLTGRRTPTGAESSHTYDLSGRRTTLTTAGRELTTAYDAAGRQTRRRWSTGQALTQSWDPAGRLLASQHTAPTGQTLLERAYTWRQDGYLTSTGEEHYTLDPAGRITAVQAANWSEAYAYDRAGNQTHAAWPERHPGSDAAGPRTYTGTRIHTAGTLRYEHDAAGRTTLRQKTRDSRKPDTWRYTWDTEDHLTAVTTPDGTRWHYLYDPLGRRIAKQRLTDNDTIIEETRFTWHDTTLIEQVATSPDWPGHQSLTWDYDDTSLVPLAQTTRYTPAADAPPSEIDTRFHTIITDLIGTPTHLVDETGTITWQTRTTLWGTTTWNQGATAYTPLRFPGQYHDLETGHHYNLHRHYDPETARYLTPDPLGLEAADNPLAYVHNPHNWSDPHGLAPCRPLIWQVENQGAGSRNIWTTDLSHVTGRTARSRNRAIDIMIRRDFPNLRFTHQPKYSPWVSTGIARRGTGTQIGKSRFGSSNDLRNTLVHEELHHRWFSRNLSGAHHPRNGSGNSARFYGIVERYMRMRGWE